MDNQFSNPKGCVGRHLDRTEMASGEAADSEL